jgi:Mor family transcriptional regulator
MNEREQAVEALADNNNKMLNDYINGYSGASDLAKKIGVDRSIIYLAIEDLDNQAVEKRENNYENIISALVERIKRNIPYESMNVDIHGLMGGNNNFETFPIPKQKSLVSRRIERNKFNLSIEDFQFVSQGKIDVWYKNYCVFEAYKSGENKPYQIAKKYGVIPRKIYDLIKFFNDNKETGRFIKGVPMKQQAVFVENAAMFKDFEDGASINEIATKYDVKKALVKEVIDSLKKAKSKLQ